MNTAVEQLSGLSGFVRDLHTAGVRFDLTMTVANDDKLQAVEDPKPNPVSGRPAARPMSRLARRLRRRLVREGVALPPVIRIQRTYAGRNQRAQGAWAWQLRDGDGNWLDVGSQWPAHKCASAEKLSFWCPSPDNDTHVIVDG